ncbi:MAG: beta-ketoacyl synthase chain length factor [Opitutales bacterium]|nr:beta-ketoacyl synthase chain length factor [Opitutales bacterium]
MFCAAAREALGGELAEGLRASTGVFAGTSIGGIFEVENEIIKLRKGIISAAPSLTGYECSTLADIAAKSFSLGGMRATFSTACSSSGIALDAAIKAVKLGKCRAALVGGADALSRITVNGFGSLLLLSKFKCRPFDADRDGINLGDGAAALFIMDEATAGEFGLAPLAFVDSAACTCDAYHATSPSPDGSGAARAMKNAIEFAGGSPSGISAVLAHGTGTEGNDSSEFFAMKSVFKGAAIPPYASLKRVFSHTLGASGAINAAIAIKAIQIGRLPPSAGFKSAPAEISKPPSPKPLDLEIKSVLTTSIGFGGNNASSVFSKYRAGDSRKSGGLPAPELRPVYLKSAGVVSPLGNSPGEFCENFAAQKRGEFCDASSILKEVPPLKKRKFARMQQMALEAANQAIGGAKSFEPESSCVCFATGIGMSAETARFLEGVLDESGAKPLPSAFTNSVHNAPPSAIANARSIKGLNSAATAKEASFELALMQAMFELNLGGASSAVVAAADEKSPYAKYFEPAAKYSRRISEMSEGAIAYVAGLSAGGAFAKVLDVSIFNRPRDPEDFAREIGKSMSKFGVEKPDAALIPQILNAFEKRYYGEVLRFLNIKNAVRADELLGCCYINSAYAPLVFKTLGRGFYAQINLTSTSQAAFSIMEIL